MVISIASQKGGTGKTSTSISLAAGLARKGKRVLLVDVDSQANSSKVLLPGYPQLTKEATLYATILERAPLVVHPTAVPNLSLAPSHILLSNTDIELTTAKDHRESRLKAELDRVRERYDYVFLDNPPALGCLTLNSFTASDKVLVVVSPGYFELDSLVQLGKTLEEVREYEVERQLTQLGTGEAFCALLQADHALSAAKTKLLPAPAAAAGDSAVIEGIRARSRKRFSRSRAEVDARTRRRRAIGTPGAQAAAPARQATTAPPPSQARQPPQPEPPGEPPIGRR